MESANIRSMMRIAGGDADHKMYRLLDFTDHPRDIADPWYTGDFESTYRDVTAGCSGLLKMLTASQDLHPKNTERYTARQNNRMDPHNARRR